MVKHITQHFDGKEEERAEKANEWSQQVFVCKEIKKCFALVSFKTNVNVYRPNMEISCHYAMRMHRTAIKIHATIIELKFMVASFFPDFSKQQPEM